MLNQQIIDRFFHYVTKTNSCWLWIGHINDRGYGSMSVQGKMMRVHRISYLIHKGRIPAGLEIIHSCDVRHCVNPEHLRSGTHLENMKDTVMRNRRADVRGSSNPSAKLTDTDIQIIRSIKGKTISAISRMFSVSRSTIRGIVNRETWISVGAK